MTDQPRPGAAEKFYRPALNLGTFVPRNWPKWLMVALLYTCIWLPRRVSYTLGSALGSLMYALNAKRRRVARINLKLCFPELGKIERQRMLRRHFFAMGRSYLDLGLLAWAPKKRLAAMVRVVGAEHLDEFANRKQGVILVAPHCVGMNVASVALGKYDRIFSMAKSQRNALIDWLLNKGRTRFGAAILMRQAGLRAVIRCLNAGMIFYYLPDEDFGPKNSVFAPFFGVQTATLTTVGRLAKLGHAVVIPCFSRLLPRGKGYEVTFGAPLENFPSASAEADAARINQVFERAIRTMPEQYLWTFKIFKTRPPGERDPYASSGARADE